MMIEVVTRDNNGNIDWKNLDITPLVWNKKAIALIEAKYSAMYLLETEFWNSDGNITNNIGLVFFQPNPKTELGHSHYFIVFKHNDIVYITDGQQTIDKLRLECIENDGNLIYSHHRHHFNGTFNKIDGGRLYTRLIGDVKNKTYTFKIEDGIFKEC